MSKHLNFKIIFSAIGFFLIGLSMFFPDRSWLIISGAIIFTIGMVRKPKRNKR
ncbi:hypothetical protein [Desulforamulus reducens]|uniref:hypothetical protein n=1 Tax=Desulforamulus reducens TaxID=59610 RepID=UPI0002DB0229|nr:hypothetical protein [Desulforamulus reducens]